MTPDERFAHIEGRLVRLEEDMRDVAIALNGPPRAESVRGRLHLLESSELGAKAAEAALGMARELHDRRLTKWEKLAAIGFGFIFACSSVVTTVIVVAQQVGHP